MYQIETGIPIPARKREWSVKYPWHQLEIDQSFFIKGGKLKSIQSSASQQKARTGKKYTVRQIDGGVRVWRVA